MISRAGRWTRTPSATPLQPKKWNACFWIMLNFLWLAWLVDGLKPHVPPLSGHKMNAHFWITFKFGWSARLVDGLKPHPPPVSSQKKWNAHFWIMFNFWWSAGLVDELKSHLPFSPAKKMKCSFLDYVQLLMIGRAGQWTRTPSATCLQPKKWNAYFWITFNFWWSARLVDGLKCHPPPLSSQGMKCSFLDSIPPLMISWAGQWTRIPSATPLQTKKWYAHFCITFNFWWLARLVNGLEPHPPALSSQRMKCSFLDYIQVLIIGRAGRWTWTPSATSLQPKKWNAHFCITFNFWWLAGLVNGLEPHLPPLSRHKMKCSFLHYIQLVMIGQAGQWTQTPSATPLQPKKWNANFWITFNFWWSAGLVDGLEPHLPSLSTQKNEMLIFGLCWTSDSQLGWSMDSNPIHLPSPAKKMKC